MEGKIQHHFLGTRDEGLYIAGKLIELNRECSLFSMPRLTTGGYIPLLPHYIPIISPYYIRIVIPIISIVLLLFPNLIPIINYIIFPTITVLPQWSII